MMEENGSLNDGRCTMVGGRWWMEDDGKGGWRRTDQKGARKAIVKSRSTPSSFSSKCTKQKGKRPAKRSPFA